MTRRFAILAISLSTSAIILGCNLSALVAAPPNPTMTAALPETSVPLSTPTNAPAPTNTEQPTPTSTPRPTSTSLAPSVTPMTITVFFTDHNRFLSGVPPFEAPVTRVVPFTLGVARAVLTEFFQGPTAEEQVLGLELVTSGTTGFSDLTIQDGIARVYLTGPCNSNGATYTVAQPLMANLLQFSTVQWVKIYDQEGHTEQPTGQTNSIPFCLEP